MKSHTFGLLATASLVLGQTRPDSTSICDFYTNALFGSNNATAQNNLLTALVNTVVIGNYTTPNHNAVPGILAADATYNDTKVNLAKYFDGSMKSTNVGKSHGVAVSFLDGGGADPLKMSKPADGKKSHQYKLLTHLYSYFGLLLGCSQIGQGGFPKYTGDTSMYEVHKFMKLDAYEVQYFIQQVGLAATSFGVSVEDAGAVSNALQDLFGYKCAAKTSVDYVTKPELQSICTADDCPTAPNATCAAYDQASPTSSEGPGGMESSGTASMPAATGKSGAASLSLPIHVLAFSVGLVAVTLFA